MINKFLGYAGFEISEFKKNFSGSKGDESDVSGTRPTIIELEIQ